MTFSKSKNEFTATNILIAITIFAYIIQINIVDGNLLMGLNIYFLLGEFYWQPLTSVFSHGGLAHLGMNMFVIWQFGNMIERFIGVKSFILLYFITGILTSLFSFLYIYYFDFSVNLVGASGAICAILGFYAYFVKEERSAIVTWILLISVAPLVIGLPIAWYAHFIGLIVGFIYAIVFKSFLPKR